MADPWNAAWEEAEASVPADVLVYYTIELRHPAFLDESDQPMAVRAVANAPDDLEFGIEAGAPLNGGEIVTFKAIPFGSDRPEFAEGKVPESTITIDGVNRELVPILEKAVQIKADLVVAYREYRSDDLTEPCYGPISFIMRNVSMSGTSIQGTARLDDLANRKFPCLVYTIKDFPGLF